CSSISPGAKSTKGEATGMLSERAVRPAVSVNANAFVDFVSHTLTVVEAEARKLRHDPLELLTRAVQAMLWLLVFGQVFGRIRCVFLGVDLRFSPGAILGVLAAIILASAVFATLSLMVACLVKTRERVIGIGQVLTMPLFFASNAIYPVALMPGWLRVVAAVNPLTYQVDALRALMIQGGISTFGLGFDFAVLAGVLALFVAAASRLYPSL